MNMKKLKKSILDTWQKMKFWLLTIRKDSAYKGYLQVQFARSFAKKDQDINLHTKLLVEKIVELSTFSNSPDILCVGCRNKQELDYFRGKGIAASVVGIDLFSESQDILVMDMHEMTFQDNRFDIVYSSHSLEHSYSPQKVVDEIIRVSRPGAFVAIEVPVHYAVDPRKGGADLIDFADGENIIKLFGSKVSKVLWVEELPSGHSRNDGGTDIARVIFQLVN